MVKEEQLNNMGYLNTKYSKELEKTDSLYLLFEISDNLTKKFKPVFYNGSLYLRSLDDRKYTSNSKNITNMINKEVKLTKKQFKEVLYQLEAKSEFIEKEICNIRLNNGLLIKNEKGLYEVVKDDKQFSPFNIDVDYNPNADSGLLEQFLTDISCGNDEIKQALIEIIGCILISESKVQHMIFLQGPGGSGKTTFCEMLANFLGKELVTHNTISDFKDQTKLGSLRGKLLNLSDDIDYEKLYIEKTQILKVLSSGGIINVRAIYSQPVEFANTATILCTTNSMPILFNANSGIFRRLILLSLNKEFDKSKRDADLLNKLSTSEVKSAILNYGIKAMNKLVENNYTFTDSITLSKTLEEYYNDSDTVRAFLTDENFSDDIIDNHSVNEVYEAYLSYCDVELSKEPVSKNLFGMRMKTHGYVSKVKTIEFGNKKISKRYYVRIKKERNGDFND